MKSLLSLSLLLALSVGARAALTPDIEFAKVDGVSLRLDAFTPDGPGPFPAVILVHGGGWNGGDKSGGKNQGYTVPMHEPLAKAGFAWFEINYRLVPKYPYPACIDDVETAIRWVKAHAAEYHLDPHRLVLAGESAGGSIIDLAATRADASTRVAAVVSFYGYYDLVDVVKKRGGLTGNLAQLFGGTGPLDERTTPIVWQASAASHIRPGLPPFLLVHGDSDKSVPYQQSVDFKAKLLAAGVPCELITIPGGVHGMIYWDKVAPDYKDKVVAWIQQTLAQPAPKFGPAAVTGPQVYDVRAYGATGDGQTLDTDAINQAIEAAAADGGGTVHFPAGIYLSFSIRLKSHITLDLDQGCEIVAAKAAPGYGSYDPIEPNDWGDKLHYQDFGHSHFHNSLIWGENLEDIAITGPGVIFGQGLSRSNGVAARGGRRGGDPVSQTFGPNGTPPPGAGAAAAAGAPRPGPAMGVADVGGNKSIALKNCRNVRLRDFSILQGGWFGLLATGVDNFTIENVKVDTNRDGFDIDSCRNLRISDCSVNAINDDAIVLKSSYALGALHPCENITITGCQVSGYDPGSFLDGTYKHAQMQAVDRDGPTGRIKIGTESNGDFKNITIANCVFDRSRGLALEAVDGSTIEDVSITNITMRNVSNAAIFLRIGNRARGPEGMPIGAIRRVSISHVIASDVDARYPIIIAGLPGHPIEDIRLSDIRVVSRGGLTLDEAAKQPADLVNTFFLRGPGLAGPRDPYHPPEQEAGYPEPSMFGLLPASGLYVRHAKNLSFRDIELSFVKEDTRPVVVLDDVAGADFEHLQAQRAGGVPLFVLRQVTDFSVSHSPGVPDAQFPSAHQLSL